MLHFAFCKTNKNNIGAHCSHCDFLHARHSCMNLPIERLLSYGFVCKIRSNCVNVYFKCIPDLSIYWHLCIAIFFFSLCRFIVFSSVSNRIYDIGRWNKNKSTEIECFAMKRNPVYCSCFTWTGKLCNVRNREPHKECVFFFFLISWSKEIPTFTKLTEWTGLVKTLN